MKIESTKEKLQSAFLKADRAAGRNATLPVLECLYLEAEKNHLKVRATNLDLGIEVSVPVKVEKEGVAAVPSHVLKGFVNNLLDEDQVSIELVDNVLRIATQNTSTNINTESHADFPTIPHIKGDKSFSIDVKKLVKGFKSVSYSASASTVKPELSSVYMAPSADDNSLVFVATDSFRLAEKKVDAPKGFDFDGVLVPIKNVNEITRTLDECDGDVEIVVDSHQIAFVYKDVYLTSRLIEGSFPDYKQIIPKESKTEIVALKEDVLHTLRMVQVFADQFNQVKMKVDPSEKVFEISSKNTQVGENTSKIQATFSGESVEMNFNHKYVADAFQSVGSDSVSFSFNGAGAPVIIRGVSDNSFLYLVMPMNR